MNDNPILLNDPLGDVAKVTGDVNSIQDFLKMLGDLTGNTYYVNRNGYLSKTSKKTEHKDGKTSKILGWIVDKAISTNLSHLTFDFTSRTSERNKFVAFDYAVTNEVDMSDMQRIKSDALKAALVGHIFTERLMSNNADMRDRRTFKRFHDMGVFVESSIISEMLGTKYAERKEIIKPMGELTKVTFKYGEKKFAYYATANNNGRPTGEMRDDFEDTSWQEH